MALLQISEPGQTPDPHQRRVAVGIDLGTTHSLVAAVRHGVAECLPDGQGRMLLPSAVRYLGDGRRQIGHDARDAAVEDAANTITSFKRFMGRSLADVGDASRLPYTLADRPGMLAVHTREGEKSPVELSAEVLASLRQRAEDTFADDLYGVVITVPAYFDDAQRQATKDAARLAGLNVLRLINEPTAAAVAYGLDHGAEGLFAVYDFGGGTFDISLLRLTRGVFEVVATGGDAALGGDDIDHALADLLRSHCGAPIDGAADRRVLLNTARSAKEALTERMSTEVSLALSSGTVQLELTRAQLEQLAGPLIDRTLAVVRRTLRDARVAPGEVQGIVMVGGSTRMPAVRQAVAAYFGAAGDGRLLTDVDPDEVVAIGAAIQANALAGNAADGELLLLDVIPLSLGIETMGGLVERIVERNSTIPVAKAQDFTTFKDGQTAMALHVVQGERELVAECRSLARFELRGFAPMAAGAARIRVTFQVDADGLLSVSARELISGVEAAVAVKPSYGLADDQVSRMLQDGFAHAEDDIAARALREAHVEAQRLLLATRAALAEDGDLLDDSERAGIDAAIAALETADRGQHTGAIEAATKALSTSTEGFAALRMDHGIRRALAGKRLEDV